MTGAVDHRGQRRFRHGVLIVDGQHTIERRLVPSLRRDITAGQAVFMVVGADTARIVRDRLGDDADTLQWAPVDGFYQRLGFSYRSFDRYLRDQHDRQQPIHIVAEPGLVSDPRAPVDRVAAFLNYEAMANDRYARYGSPITCLWHREHHPAWVIDDVRKVHGQELTARGDIDNPSYIAPAAYLNARVPASLPAPPPVTDLDLTVWDFAEVAACRAAVARWASHHDFVPAAVRQVVAAGNEAVTNGLQHGQAPVQVRAWRRDTTLILDIEDHGGQPIPADAGYRPPATLAGPAGLWVARQLADVLLTSTHHGRTTVRMYFPHAVIHSNLDIP